MRLPRLLILASLPLAPALAGCGSPDPANIKLRKEIQTLELQIETMKRERVADMARVAALQDRVGTLPTLSQDRLGRMFTTHGLYFGRLTGGVDLDRAAPGDEGLRLHVTPTDASGGLLKAAGSFVVEAFDLSAQRDGPARVGRWEIPVEEAVKQFQEISWLSRYEYVLTLPWQTPPQGETLHVQVTFLDELTQARFSESRDLKVKPPAGAPATTAPTTAPAPAASVGEPAGGGNVSP